MREEGAFLQSAVAAANYIIRVPAFMDLLYYFRTLTITADLCFCSSSERP